MKKIFQKNLEDFLFLFEIFHAHAWKGKREWGRFLSYPVLLLVVFLPFTLLSLVGLAFDIFTFKNHDH